MEIGNTSGHYLDKLAHLRETHAGISAVALYGATRWVCHIHPCLRVWHNIAAEGEVMRYPTAHTQCIAARLDRPREGGSRLGQGDEKNAWF